MLSLSRNFGRYSANVGLQYHVTGNFGWVKAHSGIEGKEMADKLAKEAAQDVDEQNIVKDRIPTTAVATEIKMKGLIKWQTQWDSTEEGACADRSSHWYSKG